jgi:hypothetical protein
MVGALRGNQGKAPDPAQVAKNYLLYTSGNAQNMNNPMPVPVPTYSPNPNFYQQLGKSGVR